MALVVLQYHHISERTPAATSISPALFRAHLDAIEKSGFRVVAVTELPAMLKAAGNMPDNTVVITFDDGYRSIYTEAFPELKKRGWPFTVFVNSQPHDQKNPLFMSWDQLREMAAAGATIGNHTDSHPHLIRQGADESNSQWLQRREQEIEFAEQRIHKEIGRVVKVFAYPYGEYDAELLRQLRKKGYLGFGQQSGPVATYSDPQALPRFPFGGVYGQADDFLVKLTSLPFPQLKAVVTDGRGHSLKQPELPPGVTMPELELVSPMLKFVNGLQCFASGQGAINLKAKGGGAVAKAGRSLPVGRSRYNCTASAGRGRFYWYSQLFIRRNGDGSWYRE